MTKSKHTPGPWEQDGEYIVAPEVHSGFPLAEINPNASCFDIALIVSAPELLEALEKAKETIKAWHGMGPDADSFWNAYDKNSPEMKIINGAIAKARGQS